MDFGAVNTATLSLAEDPVTRVYYLYRESLEGGKTTAEHASGLLSALQDTNACSFYGGAKSEEQPRLDWGAAGVYLQKPAVADVEAGIDRVISLFKTRRLFIFEDCKGVLDELGTYSREVDEMGQPTEKIKDKERYHRCLAGEPW